MVVMSSVIELYEHNSIFHALNDGRTCAGYHWQYLDERTKASERVPFFFEQNMQDVWSLPLACLLVCQSAIFIGSKKG